MRTFGVSQDGKIAMTFLNKQLSLWFLSRKFTEYQSKCKSRSNCCVQSCSNRFLTFFLDIETFVSSPKIIMLKLSGGMDGLNTNDYHGFQHKRLWANTLILAHQTQNIFDLVLLRTFVMVITLTFPINLSTLLADIKHLVIFDDWLLNSLDFPMIIDGRIVSNILYFLLTGRLKHVVMISCSQSNLTFKQKHTGCRQKK